MAGVAGKGRDSVDVDGWSQEEDALDCVGGREGGHFWGFLVGVWSQVGDGWSIVVVAVVVKVRGKVGLVWCLQRCREGGC